MDNRSVPVSKSGTDQTDGFRITAHSRPFDYSVLAGGGLAVLRAVRTDSYGYELNKILRKAGKKTRQSQCKKELHTKSWMRKLVKWNKTDRDQSNCKEWGWISLTINNIFHLCLRVNKISMAIRWRRWLLSIQKRWYLIKLNIFCRGEQVIMKIRWHGWELRLESVCCVREDTNINWDMYLCLCGTAVNTTFLLKNKTSKLCNTGSGLSPVKFLSSLLLCNPSLSFFLKTYQRLRLKPIKSLILSLSQTIFCSIPALVCDGVAKLRLKPQPRTSHSGSWRLKWQTRFQIRSLTSLWIHLLAWKHFCHWNNTHTCWNRWNWKVKGMKRTYNSILFIV